MRNKQHVIRPKLIRTRLRIHSGEEIALGPGKVDLLALIADSRSIRDAAERMNMSYMRAWTLIRTMNQCFKQPLVEAARGGSKGGGARLTPIGKQALALYRGMERSCLKAIKNDWRTMKKLLRG